MNEPTLAELMPNTDADYLQGAEFFEQVCLPSLIGSMETPKSLLYCHGGLITGAVASMVTTTRNKEAVLALLEELIVLVQTTPLQAMQEAPVPPASGQAVQ